MLSNERLKLDHLSSSVNQSRNSLIQTSNTLIFASSNLLHIYDKKAKQFHSDVLSHRTVIQNVILKEKDGIDHLLVSSDVCTFHRKLGDVWKYETVEMEEMKCKMNIECIDFIFYENDRLFIASACEEENLLKIGKYNLKNDDNTFGLEFESLELVKKKESRQLCVQVKLFKNFEGKFQVIYSSVDSRSNNRLNIDSYSAELNKWISCKKVENAHKNWIRIIDVINDKGFDLLCSGSDDGVIRIWKNGNDLKLQNVFQSNDSPIVYMLWKDLWTIISCNKNGNCSVWRKDEDQWYEDFNLGTNNFDVILFGGDFDGNQLIVWGYRGYINSYELIVDEEDDYLSFDESSTVIRGHFNTINDISWHPYDPILASTSDDQTTRLLGINANGIWEEIQRPQTHGYNMNGVQWLTSLSFVSCSDEKCLRIFNANKKFLNHLNKFKNKFENMEEIKELLNSNIIVPPLTLSSINQQEKNNEVGEKYSESSEEYLSNQTLWEESMKLYGHSQDVVTMATTIIDRKEGGKYLMIASASRSMSMEDSSIIIWELKIDNIFESISSSSSWTLKQKLENVHNLTITNLQFSSDVRFLISVSRDRSLSIYQLSSLEFTYKLHVHLPAAHQRIIRSISIIPSQSDNQLYFLTGSRDKILKVWKCANSQVELIDTVKLTSPIATSTSDKNRNLFYVGTTNGEVQAITIDDESKKVSKNELLLKLANGISKIECHSYDSQSYVAIATTDNTLRIYSHNENSHI
ncbi:hypothetical protein SNEBB_002007 [Seison nebaliae]|nr:hypothetical protein SNEBB_002007 [Seison nebaliae]